MSCRDRLFAVVGMGGSWERDGHGSVAAAGFDLCRQDPTNNLRQRNYARRVGRRVRECHGVDDGDGQFCRKYLHERWRRKRLTQLSWVVKLRPRARKRRIAKEVSAS